MIGLQDGSSPILEKIGKNLRNGEQEVARKSVGGYYRGMAIGNTELLDSQDTRTQASIKRPKARIAAVVLGSETCWPPGLGHQGIPGMQRDGGRLT